MQITVADIQARIKNLDPSTASLVQWVAGNPQAKATAPLPPEFAPPGSLVFVSTPQQLQNAVQTPAGIIVALKDALLRDGQKTSDLHPQQALFCTASIQAAMAVVNPHFVNKSERWPVGISPLAAIADSAKLGKDVTIAPFAVIGAQVEIGDHSFIGPHCVIEKGARIGARTRLTALDYIGGDCEIGNDCELHANVSIGADGFGFVSDSQGRSHKIPQIGKVIIEDQVEIGANTTIDRATLHETRISRGCKLDNQVHIAHNCSIGENALIGGQFAMAGSSHIGKNFKSAGNTKVADHVNICDNVTVGGSSGVTKDITTPGFYFGFPLQSWKDGVRTLASLPFLSSMRQDLKAIKQKLNLENKSTKSI